MGEAPGPGPPRPGRLCLCPGRWHTSGPLGNPGSIPLPSPRGCVRTSRVRHPPYLEMPAKAQMFSVRLPSLSTRHEGPPGPRGHASHAAGTVETTEGSERGRSRPTATNPIPAMLISSPSLPRAERSTHGHSPHAPTGSPAEAHPQLSDHLRKPPGVHTWLHTHVHTGRCTHRPSPLIHKDAPGPAPPHPHGRRAPGTHRPPERTAAAGSRRCSRGRPQSGSPCCEWPSCVPAWASSKDSPGGHGGPRLGLRTPAAPSKAPRGAHRGRPTQAPAQSGRAPCCCCAAFPSHDPQTLIQFPRPLPAPQLGCCVPHCPWAPLLAAAGRRPARAHSVRADHGRMVPVLGQGGPQGWTAASGLCPLQTPGRAQAVRAAQGAAGGKRAGRSGRAAGAGSGPAEEEEAGSGGTGPLGDSLDGNPLAISACSPRLGILCPILPGKTPTHPSKLHHHAVPPSSFLCSLNRS